MGIALPGTVMVKAEAPASNAILSTSSPALRDSAVVLEFSNVATSVGPLGTVAGVQLSELFQLLSIGSRFQVALPPSTSWLTISRRLVTKTRRNRERKRAPIVNPGEAGRADVLCGSSP